MSQPRLCRVLISQFQIVPTSHIKMSRGNDSEFKSGRRAANQVSLVEGVSPVVKDMAFIAYSVRDVPRAVAFYRDVVGLEPGESFSDQWVEFNVGSTTFGVGNGESLGFTPGTSTGAAFEVDDIAGMRDRFLQHGVKVSELHSFPSCSAVFATDPEGNRFSLHQRKA